MSRDPALAGRKCRTICTHCTSHRRAKASQAVGTPNGSGSSCNFDFKSNHIVDTCCTQLQRPAPHRHCGSAHQQDSRVCSASQNHLGTRQGTLKLRQHSSLVLCRSLPATLCSTRAPAVRRKDANSATSTLRRASTQSCGHVPALCRIRLVTHTDATIDPGASCRELPSHLPPSPCVASPHAALSASRRPSSPDRCTQPHSSGPKRELQRAPTPTRIMHGSPAPETRQTRSSVHVL